ncbi:hypothetical protein BH23ACI1_BH23ACI1_07880 [soil metagenome]
MNAGPVVWNVKGNDRKCTLDLLFRPFSCSSLTLGT